MNQLHVELPGLLKSATNGLFGDLVKHHALHRHLWRQQLQQMPADAFSLAVFVRRQEQLISTLEGIFQLFHRLFLVLRNHIQGFEVGFRVDTEIGPLLPLLSSRNLTGVVGKVAHMSHGGLHPEVLWEESTDGAGLGGALNDDQGVRQRGANNRPLLYRTVAPAAAN